MVSSLRLRLGIAVFVLAAPGCVVRQEQETPPEPTNDRQPTSSSEPEKTSGTTTGGSTTGNEIAPAALAACSDLCDYEASVAKDCTADSASQCKSVCKIVLQNMDAQCQETARQWSTCMKQNLDPTKLTCNGGNLAQAEMPAACETITSAYVECQKQK